MHVSVVTHHRCRIKNLSFNDESSVIGKGFSRTWLTIGERPKCSHRVSQTRCDDGPHAKLDTNAIAAELEKVVPLMRAMAEKVMSKELLSDLNATHDHEEKLRGESIALIHADPELSKRLAVIEKAMTVIFGYTLEHTSRSDDEAAMQMLGIRLFNAAASGVKAGAVRVLPDGVSAGARHHGDRLSPRLLPYVA
jgi:hypothetical protein